MRQVADKIAELRREVASLKVALKKAIKWLDKASMETHNMELIASIYIIREMALEPLLRDKSGVLNDYLPISQPDSVAEKAAITMLQGMTPEQVTVWLGKVYQAYVMDQERALQNMGEG